MLPHMCHVYNERYCADHTVKSTANSCKQPEKDNRNYLDEHQQTWAQSC